ncbi:MAG TPA: YggS family pyridoxal phosphate-dependent enzyme [Candidatus Acidoferrales bacterium]|nr:YggS family pyridoxal phosphate-dependent enzyme [Candidatus Acidoferrales bacterium]
MATGASAIRDNFAAAKKRMARAAERARRSADDVTLVAISKTFPVSAIRAAWEAGIRHFGENRVQEWESKHNDVAELSATWHLVGHLQSNKARRAAGLFHSVDSVESLDLARRLDAALREDPHSGQRKLRVLLEVRLAPEETKSGVEPADVDALARGVLLLPRLELAGLMCIPPPADDPQEMRPYFRRLRELRDTLGASLGVQLPTLSMGMSHDFEVAIEEGATEVRLGTALFGSRT